MFTIGQLNQERESLITQIVTTPGLLRPGITLFDNSIYLPIQPLFIENLYGEPIVFHSITSYASIVADLYQTDVVAGAETAGVPLAAAVAIKGGIPFCYVRKDGYAGHVDDEPAIRGADVVGKRVIILDDATWTGKSIRSFVSSVEQAGGEVVCVFSVVDMRELAPDSWSATDWDIPFEYCATYYEILDSAVHNGVLTNHQNRLIRSFITESWTPGNEKWLELDSIKIGQ